MSTTARVYLGTVWLGSVAVFAVLAWPPYLAAYPLALTLLTVASFLTQVYELEVSPRWFFSTHLTIAATALYVGGPPLAMWVVLLSTPPAEVILRWDNLRTSLGRFLSPVLFNTAQLLLSVAAAAGVFHAVTLAFPGVSHPYYAMVASFLAYLLANTTLVAGVVALTSSQRFGRVFWAGVKSYHLQLITMGTLAITTTRLYEVSPAYLVLALVPLALVHYSAHNYLRLRRDSHMAFKRITDLLAERDEYTGEHSDDVERLAVRLADALRLNDEDVESIRAGAAIHDIGKMAIPDAILNKAGSLDEAEFETMKQHTIIGAEIIENIDIYRNVVPIVRHEHEHWDGSGYPDGISGAAIPIGARVVAVADVYSALTTERGYRPAQGKPLAYSHDEACTILQHMAGRVLDPNLVTVFLRRVAPVLDRNRGNGDTP